MLINAPRMLMSLKTQRRYYKKRTPASPFRFFLPPLFSIPYTLIPILSPLSSRCQLHRISETYTVDTR